MESVTLDRLDREIVHALSVDGRAPMTRIAEVLQVSDQAVARRYRRLHAAGRLRVVGLANTIGQGRVNWLLRLRCTPDTAMAVATALARRADTFWVHLLSGGTEISCVVQSWSDRERDDLLLQKLTRSNRILSISAQAVLTIFRDSQNSRAGLQALSAEQVLRLTPTITPVPAELTDDDRPLLDGLAADGRTPVRELSRTLHRSESVVGRRIDTLRAAGVLTFDVDVPARVLDQRAEARLWMSVPPHRLPDVGREVATHPEASFVGATTGSANLFAAVMCADMPTLYHYLTDRIGGLPAVHDVELVPVIRTIKRAGIVRSAPD